MKEKLKQHAIIFVAVTLIVHLCTGYIVGTLNPAYFSRDMRETQLMMLIFVQALAHYAWFNRARISEEIKKEIKKELKK